MKISNSNNFTKTDKDKSKELKDFLETEGTKRKLIPLEKIFIKLNILITEFQSIKSIVYNSFEEAKDATKYFIRMKNTYEGEILDNLLKT